MTERSKIPLSLCVDMFGCPNRCLHCWLGHMPNRAMEKGSDEWIAGLFRPYFEKIEFFSWLREPDFTPDYREQWERDKALSVGLTPPRFELASFWRLTRDLDYVRFLKENGVNCVQLTFFGTEELTDRYVGRPGAFGELIKATEILLENGISPRWQAFINEENKASLVELLHLSEKLELSRRTEAIGGHFRFFIHPGSCDGENRKLLPIRIKKSDIPKELMPYFWHYDELVGEKELYNALCSDSSSPAPHNEGSIVLYVSNEYDLYFNFTHMRPEWRIGNLKTDPIGELVRRALEEDTPAMREAKRVSIGELVRGYGDPESERAFEKEDYISFLLNEHIERLYNEGRLR